jgi:hypothetical protein
MEEKPWSREHKECRNCGTTKRPHMARGFCKKCYPLQLKLEQTQRWDLSKPESLKDFPHTYRRFIITQKHLDGFKIDVKKQVQSDLNDLRMREDKLRGVITGIDIEYELEKIAHMALRVRYKFGFYHGIANLIDQNFNAKQKELIYSLLNKIDEALPRKGIRPGQHFAEESVEEFKIQMTKKVEQAHDSIKKNKQKR